MDKKTSLYANRVIVAVCLVLASYASVDSYAEAAKPAQIGCDAPKLEGLDWVKGDAVKMKKGSVYVIEFWATWCGPCIKGIPHLTELQHRHKKQNVTVIGISKETNGKVRPFVAKQGNGMDYTVAIDAKGKMTQAYMKAFAQGGIPHAFIVDKTGKIAWRGHPMTMDKPLEQILSGTFNIADFAANLEEEKKEKERRQLEFKKKREALDKKIVEISAAIESDPDNVELLISRAQTYLGDSFSTELSYSPANLVASLQDYKKALKLDPRDKYRAAEHVEFFEAWQDRSKERIGKLKTFSQKYAHSIRIPFAMYALYYDALKKGDKAQALKYVTIAVSVNLEGRFGEALSRMKTSLTKTRQNPSDSN